MGMGLYEFLRQQSFGNAMGLRVDTNSLQTSTHGKEHNVPDFFIVYNGKGQKRIAELIEIKPNNQAKLENVGKNIQNQASYIVNKAKWEAAGKWCKHKGIRFRILTESDIFK